MLLNMGMGNLGHEREGFLYLRTGFESPLVAPVHGDPRS